MENLRALLLVNIISEDCESLTFAPADIETNPDTAKTIIEDGFANERFVFGNDPMMRWYTNNTYIKEDNAGNRTFLKKEQVRRKTDGFHAFLAALYKREDIVEYNYNDAFDVLDAMGF